MPAPIGRVIFPDPKRGDRAVNDVGNFAEAVGTPHRRYAVRLNTWP
jgi:hypothetical protein